MGLGYLRIQVHTGDDALPVTDACVVVKDKFGRILYRLKTDISGSTETVGLYAPDKYHTLNPNDLGPYYSTYEVEVIDPQRFTTEIIHNVQVFDTETSILPIAMLPLPEVPTQLINEVNITPPAIQLPIQRHQETSLIQPFALTQVVIPDYITVHLGTPTSSASNVRVKFADYIKNVASSEIYPTWPEA